ncbi:DinB family protein [Paenibacillus thalictri]|uniref:DinB family protein n=2 Tax=Paenibacillus thalictri TaxID=2527873 RepID=A0A4Q9DU38_9BACL|nr:DinB family protein [Paenibacillus thalictri]
MLIDSYQNRLRHYSLEQLRFSAAQGVWSLCQLYDHLILAALDYMDKVAACATAQEDQPLGKTEAGEALFEQGGFPPIKIKLPDGPENNPSNTESVEALMQRLEQVRHNMSEWEVRLHAINPNCKVLHDGFGWLNAQEWFELAGMHFRHHLRQKDELERYARVKD